MSLPEGFNSEGLAPHIIIYDSNWKKQLEYIHENIDEDGVRDFTLQSWKISGGVNSDAGSCQIIIEDFDAEHTFKIKPNWIIQIYLYSTQEQLWFTGIVYQPGLARDGYGQQIITLEAYGYANDLTNRFISVTKARYSDADGISSDDTGIKISELAKFVVHNDAMLIPPGDPNLTTDIEDIDIKLGSFDKENQSQAIVLAELANIVGGVYGVTPELVLYFRSLNTHSGKIITNDDLASQDNDSLYIIRNKQYAVQDAATKRAYTNLIGLDITIQAAVLPDNGGTDRATTAYSYIGFSLDGFGNGELEDIQVFLQDREPNDGDINWKVTGDGWDDSELTSGRITEAKIAALGSEGGWVTLGTIPAALVDSNGVVTPRRLWLDNGHSSYYILTKIGVSPNYKFYSGSPGSWNNALRGRPAATLRIRSTRESQTILKAQNTTLKKTNRDSESMEYLSEKPEGETATALFEGLLNQAAKIRRIYSPVIVHANGSPPPLGKRMKFVDKFNGINTNPVLIGYDIGADPQTKLTAIDMTLELEDFV